MVRALGKAAQSFALAAMVSGIFALAAFGQEDPPSRVARLNHIEGNVSMEPAGADDWAPAVVNHPFTIGDYLYTDQGARAELHMDVAALRMGPQTSFGFLNLSDQAVQIKLSEGDMYVRVHDLAQGQAFEVDTPNAAVTLLGNGIYRFRVDPNGNTSYVVVRQGQAQVTGGGQAFTLDAGNSVNLSGTDQLAYDVEAAPAPDDFDNWSSQRDAHEEHAASARYLPPTVVGYEDLDDNGSWQQAPDYGPVWYPNQVASGWAPYHNGHWAWVDPWGWTWVDDAPWGFAPFHYGRWAYISGRWGWAPGPIWRGYRGGAMRPYYAPALVAWFGGSNWGVSIGIGGGGPSLGWVPLGYGEVYTPPYACSQRYFSNVNIYNTSVSRSVNITNVYDTVYVNHTAYNQQFANARAPGAVMAMPQTAFASGRPVAQGATAVRQVDPARLRSAAVVAPAVAPTRQALASTMGRPAARPAAQVLQRQVVARNTPPPQPVSFAARQQYMQQHPGQVHNYQAVRQAVAPHATPVAAVVRQAPAARPVAVHAGQRVGNPVVASRPGTVPQPGHAAPAAQPARPGGSPQQAARPGAQQPAPAHGTPPNMRPGATGQPAANTRGPERTPQGQPAARVGQPGAPAAHGTPPNMRPGNAQPAPNARPAERTPTPAARPAPTPPARTEARPATPTPQPAARTPQSPPARAERTPTPQPAARTPQPPPARPERTPTPQPAARPAPTPPPRTEARPAAPAPQPAARTPQPPPARPERTPTPQPAARPAPTPPPRTEARPAAPPPQERKAPPPPPAKNTRDTKDTKHT